MGILRECLLEIGSSSMIIDHLTKTTDATTGVIVLYLNYKDISTQTLRHLMGSIVSQLAVSKPGHTLHDQAQISSVREEIKKLHQKPGNHNRRPSVRELAALLDKSVLPVYSTGI